MIKREVVFDMKSKPKKSPVWYVWLLLFTFAFHAPDIVCGDQKPVKPSKSSELTNVALRSDSWLRANWPRNYSNDEIRPDLKDWHPDYETLCWQLIEEGGLKTDCDDLVQRMVRCEEGSNQVLAHRLPIVSYVHRDPFKLERITHETVDPIAARPFLCGADCIFLIDHIKTVLTAFDEPRRTELSTRPRLPSLRFGDLKSHIDYIRALLNEASKLNKRAFANLTEEDIQYIIEHRKGMLDSYIDDRIYRENWQTLHASTARLLDLTFKLNDKALFDQAWVAAHLVSPQFTASLRNAVEMSGKNLNAAIISECDTPYGKILIAGKDHTRYDQLDYAAIYDLGGDDVYTNNIATSIWNSIPTAIIVDYEGDDAYETYRPFSQGCGDFGVGILVDLHGNDSYVGTRFTQGTGFCGVGMLFDEAGDDVYRGLEFHQGVGHWGAGVLVDSSGNDRYESHNTSQAVGMVGGFGLLCDSSCGRDSYYCKGRHPTSYGDPGVFEGWGQGIGVGYRRYQASGGVGLLFDQGGEDRFEAGNFSQGGGYYYGYGILYNDGNDDDDYIGSRYAQGFGCHQAVGVFIEAGGNDRYQVRQFIGAPGNSWDEAVALFIDEKGDDRYEGKGCCISCMNGWTIFLDRSGRDTYLHKIPAVGNWASNSFSGGTSLSFFVDLGGQEDIYPTALNGTIIPGGEWALFLDLPGSVADALEQDAWRTILEHPRDTRTALYLAILAGHNDRAQSLIDEGTDVDTKDEEGRTLLLFACSKGHSDVARFFIVQGADVNVKSKKGQTPLGQAIQNGMLEVARLLLDRGANMDATMLHRAVKKGKKGMVELLLTKGADINSVKGDITPLHVAIMGDQKQIVQFLINKSANFSPIHAAAYFGELERVNSYLLEGVKIDTRDSAGFTPLHWAICGGQADVMRLLVSKGANIKAQDGRGFTPLHYAAMRGRKTVAEFLLANGAEVHSRAKNGYLPIHVAAENENTEVMGFLLEYDDQK